MKKMLLCSALLMLLCGCAIAKSKNSDLLQDGNYAIEEHAELSIVMDDEQYAQELHKLWDNAYPEHAEALHITTHTYKKNEHLKSDITWISDQDLKHYEKELYDLDELQEHIEFSIPKHLNRDEQYYLPVEGKGLVFMYNEKTLKKHGGNVEDMNTFETMKDLGEDVYYHNRNADYVYLFLFTPHEEEGKRWLKENVFYDNLAHYRKLNEELSLEDNQYDLNQFYEGSYVCGLVRNDGHYTNKNVYKKEILHATKMPSYQGETYAPVVDTYDFVIRKDTKYPAACMAFLQMVRSEKGMQALINATQKTPLMEKKDAEDFTVFDHTRKEIITAMYESQLRDLSMNQYLENSSFYSLIENSLYTKDTNEQVIKRL